MGYKNRLRVEKMGRNHSLYGTIPDDSSSRIITFTSYI